jgi:hypothetical protein
MTNPWDVPQTLRDLDLQSLVGLPAAEAQKVVTDAGGVLRAIAPGQAVTLDFRPTRVTLAVVDGVVVTAYGLG